MRPELAKELLKQGMKQKEISELLDITQPAVSQYISDKRGHGIEFNEDVHEMIHEFAKDLKNGRVNQTPESIKPILYLKYVKYVKKLRQKK